MPDRVRTCERCKFFKSKQGRGSEGECRYNPPKINFNGVSSFPTTTKSGWCGKFKVNLDKYHIDGKKIYTRIDTKQVASTTGLGGTYND